MPKWAHPISAHHDGVIQETLLHPGEKLSLKLNFAIAETGNKFTNQSSSQINQKHFSSIQNQLEDHKRDRASTLLGDTESAFSSTFIARLALLH